jgi:hypothetical protein
LRGADEHFREVVVQGVVELSLEALFELGVVEVAGMEIEIVGVHGDGFVLELDDDLDAVSFGAGGEIQERMLVEAELGEDAVEARVCTFGHARILAEGVGTHHSERRIGGVSSSWDAADVELLGILRLRGYFTSRTNHFAQDDRLQICASTRSVGPQSDRAWRL